MRRAQLRLGWKEPFNVDAISTRTVEIHARRGWVPLGLSEIWDFRELVFFFLWRDVKGRYRQMALGPLWVILHPLMNMVLFTLIFGMVANLPSDDIPYPLFSYSALLPWTFFSGALLSVSNSLLQYRNLISKVYFPRLIIPLVAVLSGVFDFLVSFVVLMGMAFFYGYYPTWQMLLIPLYLLLAGITALAVGLWLASWVVHFHDIADLLSYAVRAWMFVSPVVYASSLVPERWQTLYHLNPMTNVIEGFRWALLGTGSAPGLMLWISFLIVIPLMVGGAYYYRLTERSIVDVA